MTRVFRTLRSLPHPTSALQNMPAECIIAVVVLLRWNLPENWTTCSPRGGTEHMRLSAYALPGMFDRHLMFIVPGHCASATCILTLVTTTLAIDLEQSAWTCLWNGDNMPITFYRLTHRWANFFYRGPHWKFYCCRRAAYIFCLLKLQFSTYENMN